MTVLEATLEDQIVVASLEMLSGRSKKEYAKEAVARAWAGERNGPGYPLSRGSLALSPIQRMDGPAPIRLSTRSGSANRTALKPTSARLAAVSRRRTAYR